MRGPGEPGADGRLLAHQLQRGRRGYPQGGRGGDQEAGPLHFTEDAISWKWWHYLSSVLLLTVDVQFRLTEIIMIGLPLYRHFCWKITSKVQMVVCAGKLLILSGIVYLIDNTVKLSHQVFQETGKKASFWDKLDHFSNSAFKGPTNPNFLVKRVSR